MKWVKNTKKLSNYLPKKTFKKLQFDEVLNLIDSINQRIINNENISKFHIDNQIEIRDLNGLQSTLEIPFQSFSGYYPYENIFSISAALLYFLSRTQNFLDCNKRMSILITNYFLLKNQLFLNIDPIELYELTKEVVLSNNNEKDQIIVKLSEVIKSHSQSHNLL